MRRFLLRCALFIGPFLLVLAGFLWKERAFLPAPRLTPNLAVNEKVLFISQHGQDGCDVLALGSSMALNNLASDSVVTHFGTQRYLNAGAWGVGVQESVRLGMVLTEQLRPRAVLLVVNLMDFMPGSPFTSKDSAAVTDFLDHPDPLLAHLRHHDLAYLFRQTELNRLRLSDPGNYEYLRFDPHGAAMLEVPRERTVSSRYDQAPPSLEDLDGERYAALDRFAGWLHARGVELVVLQSPYRPGLEGPGLEHTWTLHVNRLHRILDPLSFTLIDGRPMPRTDEQYCDASHFNRAGAQQFTGWALAQLTRRKTGAP
jgi:hypothetical protein